MDEFSVRCCKCKRPFLSRFIAASVLCEDCDTHLDDSPTDTDRLNWLEANYAEILSDARRGAFFIYGINSKGSDWHPTIREAIDAAMGDDK